MDVKHKELLGNFFRDGSYYDFKHRLVNDHYFRSLASGIVIPHGLYDLADNFVYLSLSISRDTSEFLCDNLTYWWQDTLQWKYSSADCMLLEVSLSPCYHYQYSSINKLRLLTR